MSEQSGMWEFDDAELFGPLFRFGCVAEPPDFVQIRRIGAPGGDYASVSVQVVVTAMPEYVQDPTGIVGWASSVVLAPEQARAFAARLLEASDEASGGFEHVLLDINEEEGM